MKPHKDAFTVVSCPGGVHWAAIGLHGKIASYHRSEAGAQDAADRDRHYWLAENKKQVLDELSKASQDDPGGYW